VSRPGGHLLAVLAAVGVLAWVAQALSPVPASAWTTTCSEAVCEGGDPSGGPPTQSGDYWPFEGEPDANQIGNGNGNVDLGDEHGDVTATGDLPPEDYQGYETTDEKEEPPDYRGYETTDPKWEPNVVDPHSIFKHTVADDNLIGHRPGETREEQQERWLRNTCRGIFNKEQRVKQRLKKHGRDLASILWNPRGTADDVLNDIVDEYFDLNCGRVMRNAEK
jgi:hypothetical protein